MAGRTAIWMVQDNRTLLLSYLNKGYPIAAALKDVGWQGGVTNFYRHLEKKGFIEFRNEVDDAIVSQMVKPGDVDMIAKAEATIVDLMDSKNPMVRFRAASHLLFHLSPRWSKPSPMSRVSQDMVGNDLRRLQETRDILNTAIANYPDIIEHIPDNPDDDNPTPTLNLPAISVT